MKKICVITGTRAEYGLLKPLIEKISDDDDIELQLIATGMHLSPEFGLTYKSIEEDGFIINKKIECILSSDTAVGISKSMALTQISFAEALDELSPNLIVVLGDRSEIFSAVSAANVACIPVAHLHGGELTYGAYDDAFRHAITKMSHLHFTSTEEYKNRVIQLGESPDKVFNAGALSVDNILNMKLMSRKDFEDSISFKLQKKNILVTFHPVTLEKATSEFQFQQLLNALDLLEDTNIIFTYPNSDKDGRVIIKMIEKHVAKHEHSIAVPSLGLLRYLSALQYVDIVLGNSSSGMVEVPIFKKATVNIGSRQEGRLRCQSIIDCKPSTESIQEAIIKAYSKNFQDNMKNMVNPYGKGNTSTFIINEIKKANLSELIKKSFYNITYERFK
jgi:GDP/UDP-N,N'-diacetylbacillosamine 2-epimerase (hydrolysing)